MAQVRISHLQKSYGSTIALEDISLDIPTGSFFTLLGPSGCGKTTLLRTIAGFHRQNKGTITIDGEAIDDTPVHLRDIGMVFQDYAIFPHLTVAKNVAFGLKQRHLPRKEITSKVKDMLEVVQLTSFADRMPHELSGGQQQRVGLARALVTQPKVLLMDEPLSNLDAQLRIDLRRELRSLQQQLGITTIYVTHDQEEALEMSDYVCVMYKGRIQHSGAPWAIYREPANQFVASFVGSNNFVSATLQNSRLVLCGTSVDSEAPAAEHFEHTGVKAAIRPEHISLHYDDDPAPESHIDIPATLQYQSFAGRELRVTVETADGSTLQVISEPLVESLALEIGTKVTLRIAKQNIAYFAANEDGQRL